MLLACQGQLRLAPSGHVVGIDMAATLRLAAVRGYDVGVLSELLPAEADSHRYANTDPITGQAAWYDLRVRVAKAAAPERTQPAFPTLPPPPGTRPAPDKLRYGAEFRGKRGR